MSEFKKVSVRGFFKKKEWAFQSFNLNERENIMLKVMTLSPERPDVETENLYKIVDAYMFIYIKRLKDDIDKLAGKVDLSIISHMKEIVNFSSFNEGEILIYALTYYTVIEMQKFEEITEIQMEKLNITVSEFLAAIFQASAIAVHWRKTCDLLRNYEKQYNNCIESDFIQIAKLYSDLLTERQQKSIIRSMHYYIVFKGNLQSGTHMNCVKHMSKINTDFSAEDWFLLFISNLGIQRYIEDETAYYKSLVSGKTKTDPDKSEKDRITMTFRISANCNKYLITQCLAVIAGYTDEKIDVFSDLLNTYLMRLFDKKRVFFAEIKKMTIKELEDDINEVVMIMSSKS